MTRGQVLAYGLLGLPLAFAALPVYVHVPRYYAETTGVGLALLGTILLAARLADALIDPWLGSLADRVSRRRMLAWALPLFGLGFVALLNPPAEAAGFWLVGALVLTYAGFSAASVAYQAWGAGVATDSALRTRVTAAREGFGLAGVVLAAALPGVLAPDLMRGIERLSWVLPPVLLVAALALYLGAGGGGRPRFSDPAGGGAARPAAGTSLRDSLAGALGRVLGDKAFRRLLLVFTINGFAAALPATLFLFFVDDVLQARTAGGPLLAAYFLAGAASLPVWVALAGRIGRVRAWLVAMLLAVGAFAWAGLLGPGDVAAFAVICCASGLALGADLALPAALAADLGERMGRSGACFGVWNFAAKLNLALAAGLALPLLAAFEYQPGQPGALAGAAGAPGLAALSFAYAVLPLGLKLLAAALAWRWRTVLEIK